MKKQQALKRAKELIGPRAIVDYNAAFTALPYSVGRIIMGMFEVLGQGKTWEDALEKAEKRIKEGIYPRVGVQGGH